LSSSVLLIEAVKAVTEILNTKKGVKITISGQLGDDAKFYQEREVKQKIQESK